MNARGARLLERWRTDPRTADLMVHGTLLPDHVLEPLALVAVGAGGDRRRTDELQPGDVVAARNGRPFAVGPVTVRAVVSSAGTGGVLTVLLAGPYTAIQAGASDQWTLAEDEGGEV